MAADAFGCSSECPDMKLVTTLVVRDEADVVDGAAVVTSGPLSSLARRCMETVSPLWSPQPHLNPFLISRR